MILTDYLPLTIYTIRGHSMEPTIKEGKRVLVFQWAYLFKEPKVGDVVIFRRGEEYWVKRISYINNEGIKVEGDNKSDSQEVGLVKTKDILGRVI